MDPKKIPSRTDPASLARMLELDEDAWQHDPSEAEMAAMLAHQLAAPITADLKLPDDKTTEAAKFGTIGGLLLVVIAFFLGRLAYPVPADRAGATLAGLWAAIGLAVSPRLVMFSRRIFIDIYITLFMTATLLFFALAERYPARRRTFLALMYVSVGLGVLTKGPIAVALPGLVFLIYLVVHRELRRITEMMIPAGVAIVERGLPNAGNERGLRTRVGHARSGAEQPYEYDRDSSKLRRPNRRFP
jgi:hypothetical protein